MLGRNKGILYCIVLSFGRHISHEQIYLNRPLSRRLDRCDRVIQDEVGDSNGGNVYNVTMRITFVTRKFGNVERNSHCDVLHITPIRVARLFLDCNGDFALKAYEEPCKIHHQWQHLTHQVKTTCIVTHML